MKARRQAALVLALLVVAAGCGQSETPAEPSGKAQLTRLLRAPVCSTGPASAVTCTVSMYFSGQGDIDVTRDATWLVTPSQFEWETASSVAVVSRPGLITPVRRGDIAISASYLGDRESALHTYEVDPNSAPVTLAPYLSGTVTERDGTTVVTGVLIEITGDGADNGKSDTTRVNGAYFINHVRMNTPLTVRASKAGYETSVQKHPGITDAPNGLNNTLGFQLARLPANQSAQSDSRQF
jgi:hypothetical protein